MSLKEKPCGVRYLLISAKYATVITESLHSRALGGIILPTMKQRRIQIRYGLALELTGKHVVNVAENDAFEREGRRIGNLRPGQATKSDRKHFRMDRFL
jgi:hypothetical protein